MTARRSGRESRPGLVGDVSTRVTEKVYQKELRRKR
jgi:hypothetical protein